MQVLIVDDEDDIRAIERLGLERLGGMSVHEARCGTEAITIAASERPDVILLDVMMPGMGGPAVLKELRAREATARLPVVFVTARALHGEVERFKALGAAGVLIKPFPPQHLPGNVRDVAAGKS